jgi:formylglycine-generating enzyme required for sulfatase activity
MNRFNKTLASALVAWGIMANNASALITIDTVPVGNAGNANDSTGFGAVGYDYRIGTYEVTLNQYCGFLNAVGATDPYGLYNPQMGSDPHIMGIARSGASGSYTYSVIRSGARPVTYVSWFDSARFVNWLHNGQPTGAQGAGTTETGAYTLNGAMSGVDFTRNANATYGLPSENEWYKAAYYQPAAQGGDADNYWLYPTRSNVNPNSRNGSASDPNSANYRYDDHIANGYNGGFAVNNSTVLPTGDVLTDVGAFSLAAGSYGTFDQGGNVWEWNDGYSGSTSSWSRGLRGSSWYDSQNLMSAPYDGNGPETLYSEGDNVGFRVVVVPEPNVVGLLALGMALLAWKRKRSL